MTPEALQNLSQETARTCGLPPFGDGAQHIYHALQQVEASARKNTEIADALMALVFSLRPDNGPAGQAWVLSIATTAMARAILASAGPMGETGDILAVAHAQVVKAVEQTQSKVIRERITAAQGPQRTS